MNKKIALLNIDMQTVYLENNVNENDIAKACEYINYTADILRAKSQTIIHIKDIENLDEENRDKHKIIPQIKILENELVLEKIYGNSFWKTDLENILKSIGVEFLILSGFSAENCVLFTYNGAIERNFIPTILQNGILSSNKDMIQATYRDREIISCSTVKFLCDNII